MGKQIDAGAERPDLLNRLKDARIDSDTVELECSDQPADPGADDDHVHDLVPPWSCCCPSRLPRSLGRCRENQLPFAPVSSTTAAHLSMSVAIRVAKFTGELSCPVKPSFARLVRSAAERITSLTTVLSLPTTARGVPAGATSPIQVCGG